MDKLSYILAFCWMGKTRWDRLLIPVLFSSCVVDETRRAPATPKMDGLRLFHSFAIRPISS